MLNRLGDAGNELKRDLGVASSSIALAKKSIECGVSVEGDTPVVQGEVALPDLIALSHCCDDMEAKTSGMVLSSQPKHALDFSSAIRDQVVSPQASLHAAKMKNSYLEEEGADFENMSFGRVDKAQAWHASVKPDDWGGLVEAAKDTISIIDTDLLKLKLASATVKYKQYIEHAQTFGLAAEWAEVADATKRAQIVLWERSLLDALSDPKADRVNTRTKTKHVKDDMKAHSMDAACLHPAFVPKMKAAMKLNSSGRS